MLAVGEVRHPPGGAKRTASLHGLRVGEATFGLAVVLLGAFIAIRTSLFKVAPTHAAVGPRLFPWLIAAGLLVIGATLLVQARGPAAADRGHAPRDLVPVLLISAGLLALFLLLETAGWIPMATVLFVASSRAFGSRRPVLDALIGVVLAAVTFVAFNYGLDLSLPGGLPGEFLAPGGDG